MKPRMALWLGLGVWFRAFGFRGWVFAWGFRVVVTLVSISSHSGGLVPTRRYDLTRRRSRLSPSSNTCRVVDKDISTLPANVVRLLKLAESSAFHI